MNIEIATRLQKLRKEKGYSQEQLAEELGISRQAVSKWERAEASPDTDNLICLARLYGISLDELLFTDEATDDIKENVKEQNESNTEALNENGDEAEHEESTFKKVICGCAVFGSIIAYIIMGGCFDIWHPSWIIFLLIPLVPTIIDAIEKKRFAAFGGYPILITAIYLLLGFLCNLWHPFWFLFITIPLYYVIAEAIDKAIHKE